MSRIYMRVIVHNESDATLRWKHDYTSGEWTPGGWLPSQFPQTPPGGGLWWQAEGDSIPVIGAITGVEARVWYDVIDRNGVVVGEFYISANSPLIESQYGNTFHVRACPNFYAAYSDQKGQNVGDHSILEIKFRNTRRVAVPGFQPSKNGFQFRNHWRPDMPVVTLASLWNRFRIGIVDDVADFLGIGEMPEDFIPITRSEGALCGGMCFATMDYFYANQLPPMARMGTDLDDDNVPLGPGNFSLSPNQIDDPVFQFIRDRLLDSFDFTGRGHRWLSYTSSIYPDDDEGVAQTLGLMKGKSWVTYREEWPRIREQLDMGKLVTIGLVQSSECNIGKNHQVVAYAYEQSGQVVKLWVYDPNYPGEAIRWALPGRLPVDADKLHLEFDITNTADGITVIRHDYPIRTPEETKRIYAILYMDNYSQRTAPFGIAIPPPGRPKVLKLETNAETITTGGTVTHETTNPCGEPKRTGRWTCKATFTFVAQISGYVNPVLTWKVNGIDVPVEAGSINVTVAGNVFVIDVIINIGGRTLILSSKSGDTYKIPVSVHLRDHFGETKDADAVFEVNGSYEGLKFEDMRSETRCLKRIIPIPVDIYTIPKPGPHEVSIDLEEWGRVTLERISVDPGLDQTSRLALSNYVSSQIQSPEFRTYQQQRINRTRFRIQ